MIRHCQLQSGMEDFARLQRQQLPRTAGAAHQEQFIDLLLLTPAVDLPVELILPPPEAFQNLSILAGFLQHRELSRP